MATSLTVAPAEAASWPAPATLSPVGGNGQEPQIAVGPDGTAVAVWKRDDSNGFDRIQTSSRPPGGTWSTATTLSLQPNADEPRVAIAPDGTTTVIWIRPDGDGFDHVQYVTRPPGEAWSSPAPVSGDGADAHSPQIVAGAQGTTLIWAIGTGTHHIEASHIPIGGEPGVDAILSNVEQDASSPQLTVGSDGTVTAIWARSDGANTRIQTSTLPPGGSWSAPVAISEAGQNATTPQVATAPDGTTTAVWARSSLIQSATRPPGGAWASPVRVSAVNQVSSDPQIATGPDSGATAVWKVAGAVSSVGVSDRPPGGSWSAVAALGGTSGYSALDPQVAISPNSTTTVLWWADDGVGHTRAQASTRPPGSAWPAADTLSQTASHAQIAIGANGTTAVVWMGSDGTYDRVRASVVDGGFALPVAKPTVPTTSDIKGKKKIKKAKAKYTFTGTPAEATFQCRVDLTYKNYLGVSKKKAKKQVPWKTCSSPYVVKAKKWKLKNGRHTIYVRAVLGTQKDKTPSIKTIKVKRPTAVSSP